MSWSQAYVAGSSPAARSRHTATVVGSKLYVFGGGDDSRVYNDLYVLDCGLCIGDLKSKSDSKTETMSWSRPTAKGVIPSARWGHTAEYIGDGKILIFGGHDGMP
jgi:hypothetical protein